MRWDVKPPGSPLATTPTMMLAPRSARMRDGSGNSQSKHTRRPIGSDGCKESVKGM
jgi:hypothetical protein